MITRVCHLSSAHHGLDTRIFHKECVSLASAGFDTHLVIAATSDEVSYAEKRGVSIHALSEPVGRISRMFSQTWRCYSIGNRLDADIYHFHDPELIPYGMILAMSGKNVIYDVHEDVSIDILSKDWIVPWVRKLLSAVIKTIEIFCARYFFSIITATPFIRDKFVRINPSAIDINNFPMLGELDSQVSWDAKATEVCYVGGIAQIRGIEQMVQAMEKVQSGVRLNLCGHFSETDVEQTCKKMSGWQSVNEHGYVTREGVRDVLSRSMAGLVTLHPVANYIDALPIKLFEYMSAGIPVIASDFPLWRKIVVGNQCGLCVDPMDPDAISEAIDYLVQHPNAARKMGENGHHAVLKNYNWLQEEEKLIRLYEAMVQG